MAVEVFVLAYLLGIRFPEISSHQFNGIDLLKSQVRRILVAIIRRKCSEYGLLDQKIHPYSIQSRAT